MLYILHIFAFSINFLVSIEIYGFGFVDRSSQFSKTVKSAVTQMKNGGIIMQNKSGTVLAGALCVKMLRLNY